MIGALSLVIVVWLGTSMNCSRRSTTTPRSTIGIRKRTPGLRTIASFVRPEPEDHHPLVLLDDADGQEHDDEQEQDEDHDDRGRGDEIHGSPWLAGGGAVESLDDDREAILGDDADGRAPVERPVIPGSS